MRPFMASKVSNIPQNNYMRQPEQQFYSEPVESYKTSVPISELLSSTFEQLHEDLCKNDQDKLIFM